MGGASDGARTRDIQDHNLALYQLSYTRHLCRLLADQPVRVNVAALRSRKCRRSRATASSST